MGKGRLMKRQISLFLVILLLPVMLFGCGTKQVDLQSVLREINTAFADDTEGFKELTDVSELEVYYSISPDDVKQFAAQIKEDSTNAPAEIVLVEAVDANAVDSVQTMLERRYHSIISMYASYSPKELELAKQCGVTTSGRFVTLIVSQVYDEMMSIVNEAIG